MPALSWQVVALPDFSARDDAFIRKAVSQSNVVINLIGEDRESPRFKFDEVITRTAACADIRTTAAKAG